MAEKRQFSPLTMLGNIDKRTFSAFAVYDSLVRKRAWRSPLIFALIMSGFALVCFLARKTHEQAVLLGGVLLGVGLILPVVWFGMFFASVKRQAKRSGLSPDMPQYFVTLTPEKIHVEKGKEQADFAWKDAHMARRVKGCIYLYVSPARAFLLPDCKDSDRAWEIISTMLGGVKVTDKT